MRYRNFVPTSSIVQSATPDKIPSPGIVPAINEAEEKKAWSFIGKLLGTTEKVVDIYTYIKTGEKPVTYPSTLEQSGAKISLGRVEKEKDWTGLTKPWGTVVVISVVSIVGFAIYKMSKKK